MSLERGIPDYWQWLLGHPTDSRLYQPETWGFLWGAITICFLLLLIAPFLSFVIASFQYGPAEAFFYVARAMFTAVTEDLPRFSLRRTLAISRLAIQEALRNRVLIGFGVFIVLLLVAGMFLDAKNSNPARVYLSFVLIVTNYLILLMALFLSTFSIPNDIKNRTIYTVVTKPIRAGEIVLGRTLGFLAVGTAMLVLMGLVSYGFVRLNLYHDHGMAVADLVEETLPNSNIKVRKGLTSMEKYHRHTVTIGPDGKGQTDVVHGHWHEAEIVGDRVVIGPPKGDLIARAPVYGELLILDREGNKLEKGINVGNEWDYRGFIEGGPPGGISKAAAIWTFSGVSAEKYPNGLPLELTIRVFRSYKGDIEQGVLGEIVIRNPDPSARIKRSGPILFTSKEYQADYHLIPRELNSESGSNAGKIDLFNDLVSSDGRVEVEVRCVEPAQYFGMARPDAYLRPTDSTFELNFAKSYLSIWLQMVLVTCLGVTLSTFLSGPVAMMATMSIVGMGLFGDFIRRVANGAQEGGGPVESTIRLFMQLNVMTELDNQNSIVIRIVEGMDTVLMRLLQAATYALPDFTRFDTVMFVADGYSIFPSLVAEQVTTALTYFVVVTIVGYFCLKTREIAA